MLSSLLIFGGQLFCRRSIGQQQGLVALNSPGGNRLIAFAQAAQHFHLLTSGHNPKYPPGTIDRWIRQSYPAPALVESGQGYVFIGDIEYSIPRYKRGSMAVSTETKMHEVEHRRRPCDLAEGQGVLSRCGL